MGAIGARLRLGLGAAAMLFVALLVVSLAQGGRTGSGKISFGSSESNFKLTGQRSSLRARRGSLAFVAHLKHRSGSTAVRVTFLEGARAGAQNVRWAYVARIPSSSDTILGGAYRYSALRRHGIRAPGPYRMIISGRSGAFLAAGSFRLTP